MFKRSPLAPEATPALPPIAGVTLATAATGIRYKGRPDLLLAVFDAGTQGAGVYTTSRTAAAPVAWCQAADGVNARALIVNAGNANAFTGEKGMISVRSITQGVARQVDALPKQVFIASTGVIGEPLADARITAELSGLFARLNEADWDNAARAIMTTDTFMKTATATATIGGRTVRLNGIAKGSGMIAPNMATLLAFVFTDAKLPASVLQILLREANEVSFNSITVDGDTSTNDTLLAFATGKAAHEDVTSAGDPTLAGFRAALTALLTDLALQVVRDGEGAEKLITIRVTGAEDARAARAIAFTIANSPLVKTAIAGEDANWGRIVGAAGRAGETLDQTRLSVTIGGVTVAKNGARVDGYDETPVTAHMRGREIGILVDLALGRGEATVYTCDLTHGYIDINGSYRS